MSIADAFYMAYKIRYDLQAMCNKQIPLPMYSNSMSLFDVLTKAIMTTENRLMNS